MIRDPFYDQIVQRLQGRLDPELFEACAADLLQSIYPTLVPIRGGNDAGMDGAVADGLGEPFPLVSTTGKKVIDNLTRNLNSYLEHGRPRRKVILATSQDLTPQRRLNLFDQATELGFTLINVYDRDAMANLLYRSPEWCQALLNLTGTPPALSMVPRTWRPQLTNALVGRDEVLNWLRHGSGDRLLLGQPGSGKTSLLRKLVEDGTALFAVSGDRRELANAIRRQEGEFTVIVDDAHVYHEVLSDLLQIRTETGANFAILVSCWPIAQSKIAEILNLNAPQINSLDLLTRDEMVDVVKSVGLYGPDPLIREILNQAQGRPGLATTLADHCLRGGVPELVSGGMLQRMLDSILAQLDQSQRAKLVLATHSLGGEAGILIGDVAEFLRLPRAEIWEIVTALAQSGIVYLTPRGHISVRPPALRHALVRDVFFRGIPPFPIENMLPLVPDKAETAMTLLGARARGANVPEPLLHDILIHSDSIDPWQEYAWMGSREARWVLNQRPDSLAQLSRPLLMQIPETAIPELMRRSVGGSWPLDSSPDRPLRPLSDWIRDSRPNSGQALLRRKKVMREAQNWLQDGGDVDVGIIALTISLFPGFEYSSQDPGSGNRLTLYFGLLPLNEVLQIAALWDDALLTMRNVSIASWKAIQQAVLDWGIPSRVTKGRASPPETTEQMLRHTSRMLQDIVTLAGQSPGMLHWARRVINQLNLDIDVPQDEELAILYPIRDSDDWREADKQQSAAARKLAKQWSREIPRTIVQRLGLIEAEAQRFGLNYPRLTQVVCDTLAKDVTTAIPWLQEFSHVKVPADVIAPFLMRAVELQERDWLRFAKDYLEDPDLRSMTILYVMTQEAVPESVFQRVYELLPDHSRMVETACLRGQIPIATLKRLLQHDNVLVAVAAAKGESQLTPEGTARQSVVELWREVVVQHATEGNWLKRVFEKDAELAQQWLRKLIAKLDAYSYGMEECIQEAVNSVEEDIRKDLLRLVSPKHFMAEGLVVSLVGDSKEAYAVLLGSSQQRALHLRPLQTSFDSAWIQKALLASDAGYSPREIATAALERVSSWTGNESEMWRQLMEEFDLLCSHGDKRITAVGAAGRVQASLMRDNALQRERDVAVFGWR